MVKQKVWMGVLVFMFANTAAAGAEWVTAALAEISNYFSGVPFSVITLVNNIPNLCAVIFTLVAGMIVGRKIKWKTLMILGVILWTVGGILPAISGSSSFMVLMFGRLAFGIGYGIMQGLSISMVYKYVTNTKLQIHAVGWTLSAQNIASTAAQLGAGFLAVIAWNYAFWVYAWGVVPLIVIIVFAANYPLDKADDNPEGRETLGQSLKSLPPVVWANSIFILLFMMSFYATFLNIPPLVMMRELGGPAQIGLVFMFYTVGMIIGGFIFGTIAKRLKWITMSVYLVVLALCIVAILAAANTLTSLFVIMLISGLGCGGIIPASVASYADKIPKHNIPLSTGITMCFVNLGAFVSTVYIAMFEAMGNHSPTATYPSSIVILLVIAVLAGMIIKRSSAKKESMPEEMNA